MRPSPRRPIVERSRPVLLVDSLPRGWIIQWASTAFCGASCGRPHGGRCVPRLPVRVPWGFLIGRRAHPRTAPGPTTTDRNATSSGSRGQVATRSAISASCSPLPAQPSPAPSGEPTAPLTRLRAHSADEPATGMQPTLTTVAERAGLFNLHPMVAISISTASRHQVSRCSQNEPTSPCI